MNLPDHSDAAVTKAVIPTVRVSSQRELRTRELFSECLVSLGAVKQDMDVFTVSREDIERLVGG